MTTLLEWLSNSGAAVLVSSLLSLAAMILSYLAHRTSRKALRIEEERERHRILASRRASVAARIERLSPSDFDLVVDNDGPAEAREIQIRLDGTPFREHHLAFEDQADLGPLGPGARVRYPLNFFLGAQPLPSRLELTWQDDSGEHGRFRTTLTY